MTSQIFIETHYLLYEYCYAQQSLSKLDLTFTNRNIYKRSEPLILCRTQVRTKKAILDMV